jgi:hypothetical protein
LPARSMRGPSPFRMSIRARRAAIMALNSASLGP